MSKYVFAKLETVSVPGAVVKPPMIEYPSLYVGDTKHYSFSFTQGGVTVSISGTRDEVVKTFQYMLDRGFVTQVSMGGEIYSADEIIEHFFGRT